MHIHSKQPNFYYYFDDGMFLCPDKTKVDKAIEYLRREKLDIEDQGDITDYLRINFTYQKYVTIIMSQPQLIDQIIHYVKMKPNSPLPSSPALTTKVLQREEKGPPFEGKFHYRPVICKLNYLDKGTRLDITYATHQCARFYDDLKEVHVQAVEYIVRYLKSKRNKGIVSKPNKEKSLEVYTDVDFAGNWYKATAEFNATLGVRNDHKTCHMAHQTRHMVTFGRYIFNNDLMVSLWCFWSIYIICP